MAAINGKIYMTGALLYFWKPDNDLVEFFLADAFVLWNVTCWSGEWGEQLQEDKTKNKRKVAMLAMAAFCHEIAAHLCLQLFRGPVVLAYALTAASFGLTEITLSRTKFHHLVTAQALDSAFTVTNQTC